jgi:hypothetical protein
LNIGPVIYFKRVRGGFFYDYGQGNFYGYTDEYQSAGAQLIFEVHLLRLQTPVEIGCRASFSMNNMSLKNGKKYFVEPIIIGIPLSIVNNARSFR